MKPIHFDNSLNSGITVVPNSFIDRYMMDANGEYVKIFLYLLRITSDKSREYSFSEIIDQLESTSKDVRRALSYWSKQGLVKCEFDSDKDLVSLTFLSPQSKEEASVSPAQTEEQTTVSAPAETVPAPVQKDPSFTISAARSRVLKKEKDVQQILFVAEQYLQHPLTSTEIQTLLYFYDELHFSVSLLDYLLDYCVSNGHPSIRYIQTVGLSWHRSGITTVEKAKASSKAYNKDRFAIMKAYGLGRRSPGTLESEMLDQWLNNYPLSLDLILEAVHRTMDQIHEPQFRYTDSILKKWIESGVKTLADVEALDAAHEKKKTARQKTKKTGPEAEESNLPYDLDALERTLVNRI